MLRFVGAGRQLFYPREKDWGTIARTILVMHEKWQFPLRDVTTASRDELDYVCGTNAECDSEKFRKKLF